MSPTPAMLAILTFSAVGALAATAVDCAVSTNAALVFRLSEVLDQLTDYRVAPTGLLILATSALAAIGAASVFYVRPLGRKGALGCGFCVIAVLSLFIP